MGSNSFSVGIADAEVIDDGVHEDVEFGDAVSLNGLRV
jgi:hypothetical protein